MQAQLKKFEEDLTAETDLPVSDTLKHLREIEKDLTAMEYEKLIRTDAILFMGPTGAGKSTLVSYFLGARLLEEEDGMGGPPLAFLSEKDQASGKYAAIGKTTDSETSLPGLYPVKTSSPHSYTSKELVLIDCPGFEDNRGEFYRLRALLSTDKVINDFFTIRGIVFVFNLNDMQNKALEFVKHVKLLNKIFPHYAQKGNRGILFALSRLDSRTSKDAVIRRLETIKNSLAAKVASSELLASEVQDIKLAKEFIETMLTNKDNIVLPNVLNWRLGTAGFSNRQELLKQLEDLPTIKKSQFTLDKIMDLVPIKKTLMAIIRKTLGMFEPIEKLKTLQKKQESIVESLNKKIEQLEKSQQNEKDLVKTLPVVLERALSEAKAEHMALSNPSAMMPGMTSLGFPSMGMMTPPSFMPLMGGFGAPAMDFGAPAMGFGDLAMGFGVPTMGFGVPSTVFGGPMGIAPPIMPPPPVIGFGAPSTVFGEPMGVIAPHSILPTHDQKVNQKLDLLRKQIEKLQSQHQLEAAKVQLKVMEVQIPLIEAEVAPYIGQFYVPFNISQKIGALPSLKAQRDWLNGQIKGLELQMENPALTSIELTVQENEYEQKLQKEQTEQEKLKKEIDDLNLQISMSEIAIERQKRVAEPVTILHKSLKSTLRAVNKTFALPCIKIDDDDLVAVFQSVLSDGADEGPHNAFAFRYDEPAGGAGVSSEAGPGVWTT